ncbi:hypothetical protein [Streptomyces sp. NEAU-S77]|uniref:hypothetical protein n=1 Tax=Streptomyces sp. NEAU-S77 TaxID=3411033 RepID=UPI003BA2EC01
MKEVEVLDGHALIWVLGALVALLVSVICGGIAGFLHHLEGNRVPAVLLKAGAAFGACLTLGVGVIGLVLRAG